MLAELAEGYAGPLKLQCTGPVDPRGRSPPAPARAGRGGRRGAAAISSGRSPRGCRSTSARSAGSSRGAEVVVQLDEPSLPAVLAGALPTASGFGRLRAVDEPVVVDTLAAVLEGVREAGAVATVLHCCADAPPVDVLARAGADRPVARRQPSRA